MRNLHEMFKAIQFVEENLKIPITVKEMADAAGYSLYHFSRSFNATIGHSPYDFIMRRRLSEAAQDLLRSQHRIIDIALDYQFNNPETFSRAFRKMFGILPHKFRKNRNLRNMTFKSKITLDYLRHINKGDYLRPETVELPTIHLLGMATWIRDDTTAATELQNRLNNEIPAIRNRIDPEKRYAVSFYPTDWELRGYFHLAGVQVSSLDPIPTTLVAKTIPVMKYARFVHKGYAAELEMTLDYVYQTWLPKSGCETNTPLEMVVFGPQYKGPDDPESECDLLVPVD
ncbi:MAG: helix-turn-helix domain-containing protein [Proteobacteria bacterium]|nr:helix-turn-helix domain-containing protein [Pseudomonadota bacterium]